MAEHVSIQHVAQALSTLYNHPDPAAKKAANAWLVDFQLKPEAWKIAYELLSAQLQEEVQFFGVQTLHTKIQKEWETLSADTKTNVSRDLMNRLHAVCADPNAVQRATLSTVTTRMCSCVAAAGVRMTPTLWPSLINDIIDLTKRPHHPTNSLIALTILAVLPEELETGWISHKKRMDVKKVLQDGTPAVLELVRRVLCPSPQTPIPQSPTTMATPTSPLPSPMLSPTGPPFFELKDSSSAPLHAAALRCARAWVEWGVPITELLTDGGALLGSTFDALSSPELLSFAADVLVELFTAPGHLTSGLVVSSSRLCFDQTVYQEVVRAAIARVLSCSTLYQQAVVDRRTEVCAALSRVASAIGSGNPRTVLSTEEGLELLKFVLTCSSHSNKAVVMPTLDFWKDIGSLGTPTSVNEQNQLNQRNAFGTITASLSALVPILVHQCKFTRDVSPDIGSPEIKRYRETAESKSEEDDVTDFRLAVIDPFLAAFNALTAARYIQLITDALTPPPSSSLTWQTIEATLYATKVVAEESRDDLKHGQALQLTVRLVDGISDILAQGLANQAIPALLASSYAGVVKNLPQEAWYQATLTQKAIAILINLLSFPPRTSALFLENVSCALVELTDSTLINHTAPIFAPHLNTIATACVSNFFPSNVRDLLSTTFLAIANISLSTDQSGRIISEMISSLAGRIVQHTNTTHAVTHEATLEVVADVQIIDSLVGSKVTINEQLVNNITQLLENIAQRTYTKDGEAVISAICRLCTTLLSLPYPSSHAHAVSILVATFVKTGFSAPLKALALAILPVKGKAAPPASLISAGGALEQVLVKVASFSVANIGTLSVDTLGSFFWAMTCAAQLNPPLPALHPALLPVAQAAIAALPRMIEDPLAATYAISYIALVPTNPAFGEHFPTLRDPCVELVFQVLPLIQERSLVRPIGDMLHALITHHSHGAHAKNAAQIALNRSPSFARFNDQERARILRVLLGVPAKPRFRALFPDIYGIAAGESDLDILLAYEMA